VDCRQSVYLPFLLFLLNATNINFIVVGLTRSGLEPKTYRTQGEHINHYTTDVVTVKLVFVSYPICRVCGKQQSLTHSNLIILDF
jgi:hypothetical protein